MIHYTCVHTHSTDTGVLYINTATHSSERQYMAVSVYDIWSVFFCTPREFILCVQEFKVKRVFCKYFFVTSVISGLFLYLCGHYAKNV